MTQDDDPGPSSVTVLISDEQSLPISLEALEHALERGCRMLGAPDDATLSLTLLDADAIAVHKREAFGVEAATDILSYPIDGFGAAGPGEHVIGDLVLCPTVAARQAAAAGRDADEEVVELLAHGLLHIAGRDHATADAEVAMAHEQRALAAAMRAGTR